MSIWDSVIDIIDQGGTTAGLAAGAKILGTIFGAEPTWRLQENGKYQYYWEGKNLAIVQERASEFINKPRDGGKAPISVELWPVVAPGVFRKSAPAVAVAVGIGVVATKAKGSK